MSLAKVIEVVSSSDKSFDDAVQQGLAEAGQTLRGISGVEVRSWTADVENNKITRYKVTLHVAFKIERPEPAGRGRAGRRIDGARPAAAPAIVRRTLLPVQPVARV